VPLFDVAAAEAAELARVGWCGWRFGRCGWFCMDRVLVTWTFEAEHRRDGSGRSAGRPPITMSVGCGNISPRRLTKAMKFLWVVAFKLHALLLGRGGVAVAGRDFEQPLTQKFATRDEGQRGLLYATAASRPARALSSDALRYGRHRAHAVQPTLHTNRSGRCLVGQRAGLCAGGGHLVEPLRRHWPRDRRCHP
jgi:hypothetical protein